MIVLRLAAALFTASLLAGSATAQVDIPFAPMQDTAIKDPDNPTKVFRIDFARVEQEFPLSRADLMKLTPDVIATLEQEKVDQIYARLTAGPVPDGAYLGDFFFTRGDNKEARVEEILGGFRGRLAGTAVSFLELIGNDLWRGKVFYRDQRLLKPCRSVWQRRTSHSLGGGSLQVHSRLVPQLAAKCVVRKLFEVLSQALRVE